MSHIESISAAPRRLVSAKEAGAILGCSWRTVLRLADAGKIPVGFKLGSLRRWDAADLDEFIRGGCKPLSRKKGGVS